MRGRSIDAVPAVNVEFASRAFGDERPRLGSFGIVSRAGSERINLRQPGGAAKDRSGGRQTVKCACFGGAQIALVDQNGGPAFLILAAVAKTVFGWNQRILMIAGIQSDPETHLLQVAETDNGAGFLLCHRQCREKQGRENGDDGDHHQQLYQRERGTDSSDIEWTDADEHNHGRILSRDTELRRLSMGDQAPKAGAPMADQALRAGAILSRASATGFHCCAASATKLRSNGNASFQHCDNGGRTASSRLAGPGRRFSTASARARL